MCSHISTRHNWCKEAWMYLQKPGGLSGRLINISKLCSLWPHFSSYFNQNLAKICEKHGKRRFRLALEFATPKHCLKFITLD